MVANPRNFLMFGKCGGWQEVMRKFYIEADHPSFLATARRLDASERVRLVIDLSYIIMKRHTSDVSKMFVDTSQCLSRNPWTVGPLRCITSSTEVYSYGKQRMLMVGEMCSSMGFPPMDMAGLSLKEQRDLAAETMSAPCIAVVLMSLALSVPGFWEFY